MSTTINLKRPNTNIENINPFKMMKKNTNQFKVPRNIHEKPLDEDSIEIKFGEMNNNLIKLKQEKNKEVKPFNKEKNLSKVIMNIEDDMEIDANKEFEELLKITKNNPNISVDDDSDNTTSKEDEKSKDEIKSNEIEESQSNITEEEEKIESKEDERKSIEIEDSESNQTEEEDKIQSKKRNNHKKIHRTTTKQTKLAKKLKNDLKKLRQSNPKLLEELINKEKSLKTKKQLQNKLKENKFIYNKTKVISTEQALQNLELIYNKKSIELGEYYHCLTNNYHNEDKSECGNLLIKLIMDLNFINFDGLRSENLDMIFTIQRISKCCNKYVPNQIQLFKLIKGINNHNEKIMKLKKISSTSSDLRKIFDNKQSNKLIEQLNNITNQNNNLTEKERKILLKAIKVYYFFREHWPSFSIEYLSPKDIKYNNVVILKNYKKSSPHNIKPLIEKIKIDNAKKNKYELKINEFNPETDRLKHIVWNESHLHDVSFCPLKIENTMNVFHYINNFMTRTMKLFYIEQLQEIKSNPLFKQIVSTEII